MSKTIYPKLKSSLQISQIDPFNYELSDPESDSVCHLDDVGYLIAEQFELGTHSLEDVAEHIRAQYGLRVSEKQLLDFLGKANSLGFLETSLEQLGLDAPKFSSNELHFRPARKMEIEKEVSDLEKIAKASRFERLKATHPKKMWGVAVAILLFIMPWPRKAEGPVLITPYQDILLRSPISSVIERILVREGDSVEVGTVVAELVGFELNISRKKAEIQKIDAELEKLRKGATREEIIEAEKKLELAGKIAALARKNHDQQKIYFTSGLISSQDFQKVTTDLELRTKEYEQAKASYSLIKSGTRKEMVKAKEAERQALLIDMENYERMNAMAQIKSPIKGVVSTPDTTSLEGKMVSQGDILLKIANPQRVTVQMRLREKDIASLEVGQDIYLKVQAFPHETIRTKLARISPTAEFLETELALPTAEHFFRAYADMENPKLSLRPGMTGFGKIPIGIYPLGYLFFYDFILGLRVHFVI